MLDRLRRSSPERFNVAITRAQALLIVVGNPHVLALDENWRALIKQLRARGLRFVRLDEMLKVQPYLPQQQLEAS